MHTIRLKINDNVYQKVMGLLNKFDKNELESIPESTDYAEKKYMDAELEEIINEPSHDNHIDTHEDDDNSHQNKIIVSTGSWRAPSDH